MKLKTSNHALQAIAVVLAAGLLSVVVGLVIAGGADPLQFTDPGPVVRWGAPFAKLVMNFAMATTVGSLVLSAFAGNQEERAKLSRVSSGAAALWAGAAAVNFVMTYLSVSGSAISYGSTFSDGLWLFATQIELGTLLVWNLGFAFLLEPFHTCLQRATDECGECGDSHRRALPLGRIRARFCRCGSRACGELTIDAPGWDQHMGWRAYCSLCGFQRVITSELQCWFLDTAPWRLWRSSWSRFPELPPASSGSTSQLTCFLATDCC